MKIIIQKQICGLDLKNQGYDEEMFYLEKKRKVELPVSVGFNPPDMDCWPAFTSRD